MRRLATFLLGCTVAALALLIGSRAFSHAAESPFAGTWKLNLLQPQAQLTFCVTEIQDKDGKSQAKVGAIGLGDLASATIEDVNIAEDKSLHLTFKATFKTGQQLSIPFVFYPAKDEAKSKKLLGTASLGTQLAFANLERTDKKELQQADAVVRDPVLPDVQKAFQNQDPKKRLAGLKEAVEKKDTGPALVYRLGLDVLQQQAGGEDVTEDAVKPLAEKILKAAEPYGPEMRLQSLEQVGGVLASSEKLAPLALGYARQAEKLLGDSPAPAKQLPVLKVLLTSLRKTGKADEAKKVAEQLAKVNAKLDEEYVKTAIPFKPQAFASRKGKSDKVVLLELFTGAQCGPCVAADVAFDALLKTYKPQDVVLLQYHLHIPRPDPMTNNDTEKRAAYYTTRSTPSLFIDGQQGPRVGGAKDAAKESYDTLVKSLETNLEMGSQAELKLKADRNGDEVNIHVEVSKLNKAGDDVHLRLVLVEDVVHYAGSNGQRLHHHVVRAFPGGTDGLVLKEKSVTPPDFKVKLSELSKSLNSYVAGVSKKEKVDFGDLPLDLKNLKVVAFIQDDLLHEVLQVAQISLPSEKAAH
jgi:hypothetical protein